MLPTTTADQSLGLPRILCLHGGGTNSHIFRLQCRGLLHAMQHNFRLVFADAPFPSMAGPDVLSVYADCGPFKKWVQGTDPNSAEPDPATTWAMVSSVLIKVMDDDDAKGATGEWVALLGFSQGAKMAASILLRQQENPDSMNNGMRRNLRGFRMGILMAGRSPLLQIHDEKPSGGSGSTTMAAEKYDYASNMASRRVLLAPTVHVHGLLDPGLKHHRELLEEWCDPKTTRLVEYNADHRLPIKPADVKLVVDAIYATARGVGIRLHAT